MSELRERDCKRKSGSLVSNQRATDIIIDSEMYFNLLGLLHFIFHSVNFFLSPVIRFQRPK